MFGAIAGGIASALAGGAMSKLFGGGFLTASGGIQGDVLATDNNTVGMGDRSEERFSRNAETELVCRLLLEKKKPGQGQHLQPDHVRDDDVRRTALERRGRGDNPCDG